MSALVVDASVGVKWFLPEVHSAEARQWRSIPDEMHVPAVFFDLEIANVLWKKVRQSEISRDDALHIIGVLPSLPVSRHPETPLIATPSILAFVRRGPFTIACTSPWRCIWVDDC